MAGSGAAGQPKLVDPTTQFEEESATPQGSARPVPETELSPEQLRIRQLEDQLARERGAKDPEGELVAADKDGENILIHFLEDGFTALGQVWLRGQELEFTVGSPAYKDTLDRTGRSWLDGRKNEFDQVDKFGKIMFRSGPWPGKSYRDATFEALKSLSGNGSVSQPSEDDLTSAEKAERSRNRAAPTFPKG